MTELELFATWPPTPEGGTTFAEINDQPRSPTEEFRDDGSRSVRSIFVPYTDRHFVPGEFLSCPQVITAGATRYLSRKLAHAHPGWLNSTAKPFLYATQILSIEGFALPDRDATGYSETSSFLNSPIYSRAKCQILYESLKYKVLTDQEILGLNGHPDESLLKRFVSFETDTNAENLTLPKETFLGVDTPPEPVPGAFAGVRISTTQLGITWHMVPEAAIGIKSLMIPQAVPAPTVPYPVDNCRGKVNSTTFANWRPGTLLFLGERATPIESSLGDRLYVIRYNFKGMDLGLDDANGNPVGFQHLLFRDGVWRELTKSGTSNWGAKANTGANTNPYLWADFHTLLRPPM